MSDPITLSALGAVALTEGIKFLYSQAGEVLKRWKERKDKTAETTSQPTQTVPAELKLPPVFERQLSAPQIHFEAVERLAEQLRELRKDLSDYADGIETVDVTDENLLRRIDELRQILEGVYQQRFTFKGEQRPQSGPIVKGELDVNKIAGYAAAVRAGVITDGEVSGKVKAQYVESTGEIVGVDVDKIGG